MVNLIPCVPLTEPVRHQFGQRNRLQYPDRKMRLFDGHIMPGQIFRQKDRGAGDLVNVAPMEVGGKGGGRPDMAQAGGSNPAAIPQALAAAKSWMKSQL